MAKSLRAKVARLTLDGWTGIAYTAILVALLVFVGYLVVYSIYAYSLFRFPFDYDQGEGFELVDTLMFSRGQWPYQSNDTYPFYSSNYPPVFHLVVVPLVWLFGPQYWTGRLVSFLGTLITGAVIGYVVQRHTRRWWLATISGLTFLASNYVYHVGPLFRQHMFMVMFETLAIVTLGIVVQRGEASGKRNDRGLLVVIVFLLLAGYTKQLAYATVGAAFTFLFLRQLKRAIMWAIPFAAVTAAIFFLINWATQGQWLTNTITANVNPFFPGQAAALYNQWFHLHPVIVVAAAVLALYQLYFERLSIYAIWFVFAAVNAVSAGKWGAGESYFATAIAAACIVTGLLFGRVLDWSQVRGRVWHASTLFAVAALFLVQANRVYHLPTHTPLLASVAEFLGKPTQWQVAPQTSCSEPRPPEPVLYYDSAGVGLLGRPPNATDTRAGLEIAREILAGDSAAFSEEAGFNLYVGRDVVTNPTQLLNLYNNNQVDLDEMLDMLEQQQFDTVIFRAQFYPPPVLEVIGRRYETTRLIEMNGFVYCILRPKGKSA
jgi:4-amino-4-deoxy-L-arabinose transferase-like glycosyltransferase